MRHMWTCYKKPTFGCTDCIKKRGKTYDNNITYQLDLLSKAIDELNVLCNNTNNDISFDTLDNISNRLETIKLELHNETQNI